MDNSCSFNSCTRRLHSARRLRCATRAHSIAFISRRLSPFSRCSWLCSLLAACLYGGFKTRQIFSRRLRKVEPPPTSSSHGGRLPEEASSRVQRAQRGHPHRGGRSGRSRAAAQYQNGATYDSVIGELHLQVHSSRPVGASHGPGRTGVRGARHRLPTTRNCFYPWFYEGERGTGSVKFRLLCGPRVLTVIFLLSTVA